MTQGERMATKPIGSHGSTVVDGWARGHLPSSGCLLGVLVETCDLRPESETLRGSTAQRWFRGEPVRPTSQERIISEIARSARASFGDVTLVGSEELLTCMTVAWDGFRGTASSMSNLLESSGGPWAIPVLIVRGFVMASVADCLSVVGDDDASPRRSGGVRALLRRWQAAGSKRLSRDELARLLRRSRNAIDAWLDHGALPKRDSIVEVARVFGRHLGRCEHELAIELRRRVAVDRLGRRMLEVFRRRPRWAGRSGSPAVVSDRRQSEVGLGDRPRLG